MLTSKDPESKFNGEHVGKQERNPGPKKRSRSLVRRNTEPPPSNSPKKSIRKYRKRRSKTPGPDQKKNNKPPPNSSLLHHDYPIEKQKAYRESLKTKFFKSIERDAVNFESKKRSRSIPRDEDKPPSRTSRKRFITKQQKRRSKTPEKYKKSITKPPSEFALSLHSDLLIRKQESAAPVKPLDTKNIQLKLKVNHGRHRAQSLGDLFPTSESKKIIIKSQSSSRASTPGPISTRSISSIRTNLSKFTESPSSTKLSGYRTDDTDKELTAFTFPQSSKDLVYDIETDDFIPPSTQNGKMKRAQILNILYQLDSGEAYVDDNGIGWNLEDLLKNTEWLSVIDIVELVALFGASIFIIYYLPPEKQRQFFLLLRLYWSPYKNSSHVGVAMATLINQTYTGINFNHLTLETGGLFASTLVIGIFYTYIYNKYIREYDDIIRDLRSSKNFQRGLGALTVVIEEGKMDNLRCAIVVHALMTGLYRGTYTLFITNLVGQCFNSNFVLTAHDPVGIAIMLSLSIITVAVEYYLIDGRVAVAEYMRNYQEALQRLRRAVKEKKQLMQQIILEFPEFKLNELKRLINKIEKDCPLREIVLALPIPKFKYVRRLEKVLDRLDIIKNIMKYTSWVAIYMKLSQLDTLLTLGLVAAHIPMFIIPAIIFTLCILIAIGIVWIMAKRKNRTQTKNSAKNKILIKAEQEDNNRAFSKGNYNEILMPIPDITDEMPHSTPSRISINENNQPYKKTENNYKINSSPSSPSLFASPSNIVNNDPFQKYIECQI